MIAQDQVITISDQWDARIFRKFNKCRMMDRFSGTPKIVRSGLSAAEDVGLTKGYYRAFSERDRCVS